MPAARLLVSSRTRPNPPTHHDTHTQTEGSWDDVTKIIGQCHSLLHANGVVRIQSDIRIGSRTDKNQHFKDKVAAVEKLLASDNIVLEDADISYDRDATSLSPTAPS